MDICEIERVRDGRELSTKFEGEDFENREERIENRSG